MKSQISNPASGSPSSQSEISNSKSQISNPASSWHGWPTEAPPPAIAPFDAEQAQQHQEAWAKYLGVPVEYTNSLGMKCRLIPPGEFTMGSAKEEIEEVLKSSVDSELEYWTECFRAEAPDCLERCQRCWQTALVIQCGSLDEVIFIAVDRFEGPPVSLGYPLQQPAIISVSASD